MTSQEITRVIETELSRQGIRKGQFYEDCDVSSATFSQWRSGRYYPSSSALKRIADYLKLDLKFSVDGNLALTPRKGFLERKKPAPEPASDEQVKYFLFGTCEGISDAMLDDVKHYAKMLLCYERNRARKDL